MTESNGVLPTAHGGTGHNGTETAATRRGVHDRLASMPVSTELESLATVTPTKTLPLRVEAVRQLKRRRTQLSFAVVLLLPIIMALAFKVGGAGDSTDGSSSALVGLATVGAGNFALFAEFASVGFLLVVIVALFCGDTVASEASWSSLRYLLAIPVPRSRLLRQKLIVALTLSLGANVLLPIWAFLVGGVFFGWAPARSPVSGTFTTSEALTRLAIVVGYASIQALIVAALAFLLGVVTDAPLGAVGGAVMLFVVSNILDSITALDPYRRFLPTHFQYAWLDALGPTVSWADMTRGTGLALVYSAVFFALAWWKFEGKDITS
ncbi:ABC-2 type transport system permease protein [Jatrophihabitans sp. GAS493]|nr:ABC transporter permease subunit [Jatrophihabitans sp. GAS493]SOD72988.1 ABC-2 type transport system permease protein [Jatrophihabitans sp. GAS493]